MRNVGKFLAFTLVAAAAVLAFAGEARAHSRFFFGVTVGPPAYYGHYYRHYPYPYYRHYYPRYYNYPRSYYYPAPRYYYYQDWRPYRGYRSDYGYLRTMIEPGHAEVYVDGGYVGRVHDFDGPVNHAQLPPGKHTVEFRAPGYLTYMLDVYVQPGGTTTVEYDLRSARR